MFPTFLFLTNPPSQYEDVVQSFMKANRFQIHAKQNHRQQLLKFDMDQKYIDSPLAKKSYARIQQLKKQLDKYQDFDTVIVAPLLKSIQTCYELFKVQNQPNKSSIKNKKITCYIQPLLCDILNTAHSIGNSTPQNNKQYNPYKQFFQNFALVEKSQFIKEILSKNKKFQLLNNLNSPSARQYYKLMKQKGEWKQMNSLQTKLQFIQRLQQLKYKLLDYEKMSGTNKKILIIASADVLNLLACTDFHQDGQPVNPLRLNCGQIDQVNLVINGQNTLQELDSQLILPFCK